MPSVEQSWNSIHAWLGSKAPKILGNLNAPATESVLKEVEAKVGTPMPRDWVETYQIHDGMHTEGNMGSLLYGMQLMPLAEVMQRHHVSEDGPSRKIRAGDPQIRQDAMHREKWVALAHDFGDCELRIDLEPSPTGQVGQVIFLDHSDDTAILMASSVSDLLGLFVSDLEGGRYFLNPDALADGDEFLDCLPDYDVVNWAQSDKWKRFHY
jgi:cell wall assembly regulator SMI1